MLLAKKARVNKASLSFKDLSKPLGKLVAIFIGNFICAFAFNSLLIPNQLLSGGITGIAIMVHYIIDLPVGLIIFLLNLPIFIIGARIITKQFAIYSFISMVIFSVLMELTKGVNKFIEINDILIETIIGGVLLGIGMGMMFRNRVSQGGMDIIAAVLKKKLNIELGTVLMGTNSIIIGFSSVLFGIRPAMYTLIALFISYQIVDRVQQGLDTKKTVIIVSSKPQRVADAIIKKLHKGATFLNGEGAFNKDNKKIIYCTVTSTQVGKLKEIIDEIDAQAFITINDVKEVKGRGFRNIEF